MDDLPEERRRADIGGLIRWLREDYTALFAHPRLVDRLEAYAVMYTLRSLVGRFPEEPDRAGLWRHLRDLVDGRGYLRSSVAAP